jgi:DNA-binding response OmpR family regulator
MEWSVAGQYSGRVTQSTALRTLVYSSEADTRGRVMLALGHKPAADLPEVEFVEVATAAVAIRTLDAGGVDLAILDGEAAPFGGLGLAKQLRDELDSPPPILVLTGRADDRWLADWSRADAWVPHPLDPILLADTAVSLLRGAQAYPIP